MQNFVVFKWRGSAPKRAYRSGATEETSYGPEHVNNLAAMLARTQKGRFRLVCVTDDTAGLDAHIDVYPIPEIGLDIIRDHGGRFCKLLMFSEEFQNFIGDRFVYLDLDTAVCGDLSEIMENEVDLVILRGAGPTLRSNKVTKSIKCLVQTRSLRAAACEWHRLPGSWCRFGSGFMVVSCGAGRDVWLDFDGLRARQEIDAANLLGTDQAWLHLHFSGSVRMVDARDGVWRFGSLAQHVAKTGRLPVNLKLVTFGGHPDRKPWVHAFRRQYPWLSPLYPESKIS